MNWACFNCSSTNLVEVAVENRKRYHCNDCNKTLSRFKTIGNNIFEKTTPDGIKHITVAAAIFNDRGQLLLNKRRVWPYLYAFPAGHLENGETPEFAIHREMIEELGLNLQDPELIFHSEMPDECRYGGGIHEWFLFRYQIKNKKMFINSEIEGLEWFDIAELPSIKTPPSVRKILDEVIIEHGKTVASSADFIYGSDNFAENVFTDRQSELLYHISQALFGTHELDHILNIAAHEVLSSFKIKSIAIQLVLQNKLTHSVFLAKDSQKTDPLKTMEGIEITKKVIATQKIITNYDSSETKKDIRNTSVLGIPLLTDNNLVGIIVATDNTKRYFSEEEVQTLSILSTLISLAIQNSRLHQKQEAKIQNLSKIFSVALVSSKKVKSTIDRMVDTIPNLFESEKALLFLIDKENDTLEVFSHAGISESNPILRLPIRTESPSMTNYVIKTKKPHITTDASKSKRIIPYYRQKLRTRSVLSVPVMTHDRCIGVLHIINKQGGAFNDEDVSLASVVASRIGSKIENASLQNETLSEKVLLDNVIEHTNEGIVVVDNSGKIKVWNKYLQKLTGLSCNRAIHKIGLHPQSPKNLCCEMEMIIKEALQNPSLKYLEKELPLPDETTAWFGITISHINDDAGQTKNIVFLFRNISKEKELLRAKNDLITTATHELRTPLTAIKGYLSMVLAGDAGEVNPQQARFLERAHFSSERLVKLVEDLLSTLRIEENRVNLTQTNFKLNSLITDSIESLRAKAVSKKIIIEFADNLDVYVFADKEKLKHVVDNILDNAIKYTPERGKVGIRIKNMGPNTRIEISDSGVGIPKGSLETVFDSFTRIENPLSVQAGGTGLGLYIAKSLLERQGGKIWVESVIKNGSTFYITIPSATSVRNN